MKTISTLIATLVATAAFATEPAKTPAAPASAPVATTAVIAPATPAKCDAAKDKHCKVEKKAEVKPVKSEAPVAPAAAKASEPAKK